MAGINRKNNSSLAHLEPHEAGVRYIDMTPLMVLLLLIGAMVMRYVAKGAGVEEMTMVAGVGMALFTGVRFLLGMLRGRG